MSAEIIVVGLGPGPVKNLTREAEEILLNADEVYFRFRAHPVVKWLSEQGKQCLTFDHLYSVPGISYTQVYMTIIRALIKAAKKFGRVVYGLPGNPFVFEKTPRWLREEAGPEVKITVIPGLSFLEIIYTELELDPEEGLQILNANGFGYYGDFPFTEKLGLLLGSVGLPAENTPDSQTSNVDNLARSLLKKFPPEHPVTLFWSTGLPDYENKKRTFLLSELVTQTGYVKHLASLYVPPIRPPWEWVKKP